MSARVTTPLPHWFATLQVKVVKKQQSKLFALQGKGLRGAMARGKNYRILSAVPADPGEQVTDLRGNILGRWTIVYTQKILKILYCRHTAGGRSCTSALNTSCLGHGREYTAVVISKGLMRQDLETQR